MTYTARRIILVGNGPISDPAAAAFIDGHDLVVRFNNFAVGGPRGTPDPPRNCAVVIAGGGC